ncbi:MAG: hypothetical protein ACOX6J_06665, partial [Oscillospiraceae bacterium]
MKTNIKRILASAMLFVLLASMLFGCGRSSDTGSSTSSDSTSSTEGVVWEENLLSPDDPITVRFYSYG